MLACSGFHKRILLFLLSTMTQATLKDKIASKRLPGAIVDKLKASNIQNLHELTTQPEVSSAIEMMLNPLQISKFRKLISEDCDDCAPKVEKESILVEREKSATKKELEVQLQVEKSTMEFIIALLLDDSAQISIGAKRKLEMSKAAHQARANRLKALIKTKTTASNRHSKPPNKSYSAPQMKPHRQQAKKLTWRCPEVEGVSLVRLYINNLHHFFIFPVPHLNAGETNLGFEGYAQQFTRAVGVLYDRVCCSISRDNEEKDESGLEDEESAQCDPTDANLSTERARSSKEQGIAPEDTPEPVKLEPKESCTSISPPAPSRPPRDLHPRREEPTPSSPSVPAAPSVMQQHLPSTAHLQYSWHGELVCRLARICREVRDYNERGEAIHQERKYLREEEVARVRTPLSNWPAYRAMSRSCMQRSADILAAHREQCDHLHDLFESMRRWNFDATEFNLFMRSNPSLDQSRYVPHVRVKTCCDRSSRGSELFESYLTVFVASPERALVHLGDAGVNYRALVLSALTSLEWK